MLKIIAHRLFSSNYPENSESGILYSIKNKAWGIETDIQLTKDKIPVLFHDKQLGRTTDQNGYLKDWKLSELDNHCKLSNGKKIPTLEYLLATMSTTNIKIYLEIIEPEALTVTLKLVDKYSLSRNIILSSFHHEVLLDIKSKKPDQRTMALFECNPLNPVSFIRKTRSDEAGIGFESIDNQLIVELKKADIGVYAWTVNNDLDIKKSVQYQLDGIFTDRSDLTDNRTLFSENS